MTDLLTRPDADDREILGDLVPVFVYGTLRVGHGNHRWAAEGVVRHIEDCTAEGRIYWVHGTEGYPVAKFDETGTILGDILFFDAGHPTYQEVVRMEVGAGYEVRTISAFEGDGTEVKCEAFHYLRRPRGQWIEDGDWARHAYR